MKRHKGTAAAIESSPMEMVDSGRNTITRVNEHGLTEKQEMFAQGVAKGLTLAEAYRSSYNADEMKQASIYSEASRLMDNPAIAARAKALMARRQEQTFALDSMRVRQHVFDRLMIESVTDENPPAARIKALELLGKIDVVSMFKELKGPADELGKLDERDLQAKLQEALGRLIDVSPVSGTKASQDD
jgi:hypothetical protein